MASLEGVEQQGLQAAKAAQAQAAGLDIPQLLLSSAEWVACSVEEEVH
jgi:hypothetical protein